MIMPDYVEFFFTTKDDEVLTICGELTHEVPAKRFCLPEDSHDGSDAFFEAEKITCEDGAEFKGDLDENDLLEAACERMSELTD